MRKEKFIVKAADVFDVPADVRGGLVHIEVSGNREVFIENHKGIINLAKEEVRINSPEGVISVCGSGLFVAAMNGEELRLKGQIESIAFCRDEVLK